MTKKATEKKITVTSTNDRDTFIEMMKKATGQFIQEIVDESDDNWHLKDDHSVSVKLEEVVVKKSWKHDPETEFHFKCKLL